MIVSQNDLRRDTMQVMRYVDEQIKAVEALAESMRTDAVRLRDSQGNFVLPPLLLAKAQTLNTLVLLQQPKR